MSTEPQNWQDIEDTIRMLMDTKRLWVNLPKTQANLKALNNFMAAIEIFSRILAKPVPKQFCYHSATMRRMRPSPSRRRRALKD